MRERCFALVGRWRMRELAQEDELEIPVQANGKLVNVVKVPVGSDEADGEGCGAGG